MKKIYICILLLVIIILTGCFNDEKGNNENQNPDLIKILYLDNAQIEDDKILVQLNGQNCYSYGDNYYLTINFDITNKEYEANNYTISAADFIKESTSASYALTYNRDLFVEAELKRNFSFSTTIPSSINEDNYKLYFELNSYKITFYLYETPDELRVDRNINYYISDRIVRTETIKDKRKLNTLFTYESSDHLMYCDTWYIDEKYQNKFSISAEIIEDINLYGIENTILNWMTTSSDIYSYVSGINHIPSDGILVIPSRYRNKEIAISNFAIRNIFLKEIYIPITVRKIYGGNFKEIGNATIYYEGTQEQWEALFYSKSEIVKTNMVFNVKYNS